MKKIVSFYKYINRPHLQAHWIGDILIVIPRIVSGLLLTIGFGADKFGMPWTDADWNLDLFEVIYWFPQDVAAYGGIFAMFPIFFAWMGAFSEAVGGLFLVLGWNTRVFGFLVACTMLVAIFCQKWGQGTWSMLPAMGFLWVSIYAVVMGSGRIGIDYVIEKKWKS